ncbi:MarR family winged helix-turn-helix transcriptional regulator [Microbacterium sp. NPDC089698]|uniref:MarR family winged helix-turn-helix transcriptional regulator n=1 Tax=Microbacterium sp. NPDC089698 TaxID=3364200 RepID=UPI0037FD9F98
MRMSEEHADAHWELGKLVHDLDMQCAARMRDRVAPLGLTVAQASALREMSGAMTMKELALKMSCEPSNATVIIDKLEAMALIERQPHPTDRRAKQLTLTEAGSAQRKMVLRVLAEGPIVAGLSQGEMAALEALLNKALARPREH